jgi:hypothetical protein
VANLYLVGANAMPGGGTPAVMMSAKVTARTIAEDLAREGVRPHAAVTRAASNVRPASSVAGSTRRNARML